VIGYYVSPAQLARSEADHRAVVAWLDRLFPPAEIARIIERSKADTRPKRTMEDVLRLVEDDQCSRSSGIQMVSALAGPGWLEARAARGDRARFEEALGRVADVEPDECDRL
jgi:hypothetical protein